MASMAVQMTASPRPRHVVLRVILDYPTHPTDVPQFLLDAGLAMTPYVNICDGTADPPAGDGCGRSPDYASPILLAAMEAFIMELGAPLPTA